MNKNDKLDSKVKEANRIFYDNVVDIYENVDGRRSNELLSWLDEKMKTLSEITAGEALLDFGCGTGIVIRSAKKFFRKVYGVDISPKMIEYVKQFCEDAICSDDTSIPFNNESFDAVVCFSVLHHIYEHKNLFNEIYRVLKKGGILYTNHDLNMNFYKRFKILVEIYRKIFNPERKYLKLKNCLTKELYRLTEIHSTGIDSDKILKQLKEIGFIYIERKYHWFGLNSIIDKITNHKNFSKYFAPLVSILVKK